MARRRMVRPLDEEAEKTRLARLRASAAKAVAAQSRTRGYKLTFSGEEVKHQTETIEALMVAGIQHTKIVSSVARPIAPGTNGLGITKTRALKLIGRIDAKWAHEDLERRATWKSTVMRRILGQIQACQGKRGRADPNNPESPIVWIEKPNHSAIIRYENLLADIQGTREPLQVDVNVQVAESLVAVFSNYSLEKLTKLRDRALEKRKLATAYLMEHPEVRAETITVKGEPVP